MAKNKKTGETKYLCDLCGTVGLLSYSNNPLWDVVKLM
jgi:hypothetical protein